MKRKSILENRNEYASILTKVEGGKSQIKVGDMRQALKIMVRLETALIRAGYKSAMMVLRREAVAKAKALKKK
jgi:hypothetical protein